MVDFCCVAGDSGDARQASCVTDRAVGYSTVTVPCLVFVDRMKNGSMYYHF